MFKSISSKTRSSFRYLVASQHYLLSTSTSIDRYTPKADTVILNDIRLKSQRHPSPNSKTAATEPQSMYHQTRLQFLLTLQKAFKYRVFRLAKASRQARKYLLPNSRMTTSYIQTIIIAFESFRAVAPPLLPKS